MKTMKEKIKEFMKRAIREITEDAKEMGKAQRGWTLIAIIIAIIFLGTFIGW